MQYGTLVWIPSQRKDFSPTKSLVWFMVLYQCSFLSLINVLVLYRIVTLGEAGGRGFCTIFVTFSTRLK